MEGDLLVLICEMQQILAIMVLMGVQTGDIDLG